MLLSYACLIKGLRAEGSSLAHHSSTKQWAKISSVVPLRKIKCEDCERKEKNKNIITSINVDCRWQNTDLPRENSPKSLNIFRASKARSITLRASGVPVCPRATGAGGGGTAL